MTDTVSLVNLALQSFGSRTTVTAAQLAAGSNNEAKQATLAFENTRNGLLRMAPWNCAMATTNLVYITSVPGTPENTSAALTQWQPGIPRPPWAYEYQYPVDCLKPCWLIPNSPTGAIGVPITTAITGSYPTTYALGPIMFKVGTDRFWSITSVTIATAGVDYQVGDTIILEVPAASTAPIGAPAEFVVTAVDGLGGVVTAIPVNQVSGADPSVTGSYFDRADILYTQGSTSGIGTGVVFTLAGITRGDQRVILTNQQNATLVYVREVTDPNVWDPLLQDAFYNALGANLCMALTGDKGLANLCIGMANRSIEEARKADGNEGITINDVTPDWIRARGIYWADGMFGGPYSGFDWGGLIPSY